MHYLLNENKEPYPVSLNEWASWMDECGRRDSQVSKHIRDNTIKKYNVRISTVFLGLDHGFSPIPNVPPILFETMIFWNENYELNGYQWRYTNYKSALEGHRNAVRKVITCIEHELENNKEVIIIPTKSLSEQMDELMNGLEFLCRDLDQYNDSPTIQFKKNTLKNIERYKKERKNEIQS